jgi:ubiquinone/menaquinone biosynthesis C-methylase UbiE
VHARSAVEPKRRLVHDPTLHPLPREGGQIRLCVRELRPGRHERAAYFSASSGRSAHLGGAGYAPPVSDDRPLHDDVRSAWDQLASFWDERMQAGATWQRSLIQPAVERLLQLQAGERVLEIACGNGEFARRMVELGANVLATDFSEGMLEAARSHGGDVEYRAADATDERQLLALGAAASFDATVCNMAIMDMESIEPMVSAAAQLLKPDGRFVFSTLHPAFNSGDARPMVELDMEGGVTEVYSVKVSNYGRAFTSKGIALPDQPIEQWYFHRPLWMILQPFFDHGFALDGLEEPLTSPNQEKTGTPTFVYSQLPGVLVGRMRRVS